MKLTVSCPHCGSLFAIELLKAQHEIDRLRAEIAYLKTTIDKQTRTFNDPDLNFFKDIFNA